MNVSAWMYYLIAGLSLINFLRIFIMLIGSDIYDIRQILKKRHERRKRTYRPLISVVIPAYNEEIGVIRTLRSVMGSIYRNKEIIVVNDGSTDRTLAMLKNFQRKHPGMFTISSQANGGKAAAINRGVTRHAKGNLVMVLDADSLLHPEALGNMVAHFRDRRVIAAPSNVKILSSRSLLGLAQRFEYLISYRMKRALSVLRMEYIVGGVGSTFRKSVLLKVGLYDTDTITEDIDLTLKIIARYGNNKHRIQYAADALTYTEHVMSFRSLIKQRFRWKFGRFQSFLKHKKLFFSRENKHSKGLAWYQLPYALIGECVLLIEPILVFYILFATFRYTDATSMLSVYLIVSSFIFLILLGDDSERTRTKLLLAPALPFMYFIMYVLSVVEFAALVKSLIKSRQLIGRKFGEGKWEHVERSGKPVTLG